MKRSAQVAAPLLASTAMAILTGCHPRPMQRCVDEQNRVVADSFCQANGQQPQTQTPGLYHPYRFYYGGSGGYGIGSPVYGGSYISTPGVSYSSGTTRGGFGSSSSSDGGGHSSSGGQ